MDMALDDVIKQSRTDKPKGKKGGMPPKESLSKAAKAKNKAQRTNKVSQARGMEVDSQPVPAIKRSKANLKIKANKGAKVKVAPKGAKGAATKGVLKASLATMLAAHIPRQPSPKTPPSHLNCFGR